MQWPSGSALASEELVVAVARNLFKLMAYKDEYEVARLHPRRLRAARLRSELGDGSKIWFNLSPRRRCAIGLNRKLKLDPGSRRAARATAAPAPARHLARPVRLRQGPPRGAALVGEYEQMIDEALERLTPATHATAVELP